MPKVNVPAKQEIEAAKKTLAELQDYKNRFWGIGLNGDTLDPDGFLRFFDERGLPFKFFVRSGTTGVSVGEQSAYDENIATLETYIQDVSNEEVQACRGVIDNLNDYKAKFWGIGLNGDTLLPDGFVVFFGDRNLPFKYFVRVARLSLGDESAYDENIATLENYISSVSGEA